MVALVDIDRLCAREALRRSGKACGKTVVDDLAITAYREAIEHYCKLGDRRVLEGEQVSNAEKIYSIFEPHTDLIERGKVQIPIEFGHKVFLIESAKVLITQYEALDGNPNDQCHMEPSRGRRKETFGRLRRCMV
jgi:transposase, IS5 family